MTVNTLRGLGPCGMACRCTELRGCLGGSVLNSVTKIVTDQTVLSLSGDTNHLHSNQQAPCSPPTHMIYKSN